MESKPKTYLSSHEGFPWHKLPRKDRISRILSYYIDMRSHRDRDEVSCRNSPQFYGFLLKQMERYDSFPED